jgi:heme A synthase
MNDRWTQPAVIAIVVLGAVVMAGLGVWMWGWPVTRGTCAAAGCARC